jgi:hypothetical protein
MWENILKRLQTSYVGVANRLPGICVARVPELQHTSTKGPSGDTVAYFFFVLCRQESYGSDD